MKDDPLPRWLTDSLSSEESQPYRPFSRAGAATVSELSALGIPAVYVPYAVGNGEQALNARPVVEAEGALLVRDDAFGRAWVQRQLIPLATDPERLARMGEAAARFGVAAMPPKASRASATAAPSKVSRNAPSTAVMSSSSRSAKATISSPADVAT